MSDWLDDYEAAEPAEIKRKKRRFSLVWLIPIVALLIAGFLGWRTFSEQGPTITITWQAGGDLAAGKTEIRFKDVVLGQVQSVRLNEDLTGVVVTAQMTAEAERMLGPDSQFWIVRPRISAAGISGLSTIVSGAYIGMDPKPGELTTSYKGLEDPPVLATSVPGKTFLLKTKRLGGVGPASPVFFNGIEVGQVLGYDLDPALNEVTVHAFVRAPHDQLVYRQSRFWNASGLSISAGSSGLNVQLESLEAVLAGGIAFSSPLRASGSDRAPGETVFELYSTKAEADDSMFTQRSQFVSYFNDDVNGLEEGADVTLRGLKIGTVKRVTLEYDEKLDQVRVPVVFEIEPGRMRFLGVPGIPTAQEFAEGLVSHGYFTQIQAASLIGGTKELAFVQSQGVAPGKITYDERLPVFPSTPSRLSTLERGATDLLNKLSNLPLDSLVSNLTGLVNSLQRAIGGPAIREMIVAADSAMQSIESVANQASRDIGPTMRSLQGVATALQSTLSTLDNTTLNRDSPLQRELRQALLELQDTLRSVRVLTDLLDEQPDSIIRGRSTFENFGR